jgi:hypothetical protein
MIINGDKENTGEEAVVYFMKKVFLARVTKPRRIRWHDLLAARDVIRQLSKYAPETALTSGKSIKKHYNTHLDASN